AWAAGTRYASGNGPSSGLPASAKREYAGLSSDGLELVKAMDACGIIHDASHLSDAAFDQLMTHARGPVIASHSNCRALLDDRQRHLRDDQIAAIGDREGVIGLNLYTKFLALGRRATIDDCIRHVEHVTDIMGHRRGVALGSDMDGGFGRSALPVGLDDPS